MGINELMTFAFQGMAIGAAFECMVVLLGYVVRFVFRMFRKGG